MTDPTTEPEETAEAPPSPTQAPASPLVNRLTKILVYDYSDRFAAGQVIATFHDSYTLLAKTARITAFLPTLAERFTRERLDATPKPMACKPNARRRFSLFASTTPAVPRWRLPSPATTARHMCTFVPAAPNLASASNPRSATP